MILGVNIIGGKERVASVNRAGVSGAILRPQLGVFFGGGSSVRKCLGSKEHLDWRKIDFNAVEIITVQDYSKKIFM